MRHEPIYDKHAIHRDAITDVEGHVVTNDYHYLSCKACRIEAASNDLALKIAKVIFPADWPRWKYQIEEEIRKVLNELL